MAPVDDGDRISVEFISTGTCRMREPMSGQPITNASVPLRILRSFTGAWTGPLPMGAFLIRHPSSGGGPVLFDTGASTRCNDRGYFPWWNAVVPRLLNTFDVGPGDGVVARLAALGVEPGDLGAIVLSHLHHDHAGGLAELCAAAPHVPVYVGAEHWRAFGEHRTWAAAQGCVPRDWPPGFRPRMLEFEEEEEGGGRGGGAVGPWTRSCKITADGRVVAVETPGHVPGHVSLIVVGDNEDDEEEEDGTRSKTTTTTTTTTYLLAGDATYGIGLLDREEPDGANSNPLTALESLRKIKEFARRTDVVVLPSHDPDTPRLLRDRVVYRPKD